MENPAKPDEPVCPACGFPLAADAAVCPKCRWSRKHERARSREFWWALAIFSLVFFAVAAVVYMMASRLEMR